MKSRAPIIILGSGVAGLTAAKLLREKSVDFIVLDSRKISGGHTSSSIWKGLSFDEGPHVLFSKDEEMLDFLGSPGPSDYLSYANPKSVYSGQTLSHPAYLAFSEFTNPSDAYKFGESLVSAAREDGPFPHYRAWVESRLGKVVHDELIRPYTKKYWRVDTDELDIDWIGNRLHEINSNQIQEINCALETHSLGATNLTQGSHYLSSFTYDNRGFWALFPGLHDIHVQRPVYVQGLDTHARQVLTNRGVLEYSAVISTIPLDLLFNTEPVEKFDTSALRCTSVRLDDLIVKDAGYSQDTTWLYDVDGQDYPSRISFPQSFTPYPNSSQTREVQVQVESYYLLGTEVAPKFHSERWLKRMKDVGVFSSSAKIMHKRSRKVSYANVIPLVGRQQQARKIRDELKRFGVYTAGRYGSWEYLWTVEAARSGYHAAQEAAGL